MLVLTANDVTHAARMPEIIEAVRQAYVEYSAGNAVFPLRPRLQGRLGGTTLFMPGYVPACHAMAVKIVSVFPQNPRLGLPTVCALVVLSDDETGMPLALLEGGSLTALRTGASTGLATALLAREDAQVAAILGAGVQARTQLQGIAAVRTLTQVRVYDPDESRLRAYVEWGSQELGIPVIACGSGDEAVGGADVVAAATTSTAPVFSASALKPGVHINGVGSFLPDMQELGEDVVCAADVVVVDSRESAKAEPGDFVIPLSRGSITVQSLETEIGEVAAGRKPGRRDYRDITLFKSVGIAALDVAAARLIYDRAVAHGLGVEVSLAGY